MTDATKGTQMNEAAQETSVDGYCDSRFAGVRDAFAGNFESSAEEQDIGACLSIYYCGEKIVDLWGGHTDHSRTQPWREETIVNMMSVVKGIAGMSIHMLVDRGTLDLDAPVATYWPEFGTAGKKDLPLRYVLDHRAGLPVVDGLWPGAIFDHDAMAGALAKQAPLWTPGEEAGYHIFTQGYLLNEVVRRVTGETLGAFVRKEIAEPLGADFSIGLDQDDLARCAEFVTAREGTILDREALPEGSLLRRAWDQFPDEIDFNERDWRTSEIPSANGHGTARGVARIYAAFAGGGSLDGVDLLSEAAVLTGIAEQHEMVEQVMGRRYHQALGFLRDSSPIVWLGGRSGTFGHHGVGGALGFGDVDEQIGFCYAPNRMHARIDNGPRAAALIRALYSSLESEG